MGEWGGGMHGHLSLSEISTFKSTTKLCSFCVSLPLLPHRQFLSFPVLGQKLPQEIYL